MTRDPGSLARKVMAVLAAMGLSVLMSWSAPAEAQTDRSPGPPRNVQVEWRDHGDDGSVNQAELATRLAIIALITASLWLASTAGRRQAKPTT